MYKTIYQVMVEKDDVITDEILFDDYGQAMEFAKKLASQIKDLPCEPNKKTYTDGTFNIGYYGVNNCVTVDNFGWACDFLCDGDKVNLYTTMHDVIEFDNMRSLMQHVINTQKYYDYEEEQ